MTDREKTIEALARIHTFVHDWGLTVLGGHDANLVYDAIARGEVPGVGVDWWVPTKDRMPESVGEYLCTLSNGDRMIAWWAPEREHPGFWQRRVTHWMPLPPPPSAGAAGSV